jgi:small multidrug resistance pump
VSWLYLTGAILFETFGTVSLRLTLNKKVWYIGVAIGYLVAFTMLSLTLSSGMGLGVAYGIWAAAGVALAAIISRFLFKEPLTLFMCFGIMLIIAGVLCVEIGASQ